MAGIQMHEKASKIVELFNNMSYENKAEDLNLFKQWKTIHQPLKKLSIANLTDLKLPKYGKIKEPSERTTLLEIFADVIEKSMELICQISANENIRKEDTKKGTQLLIDYLRYYAACTMVLDEHHLTGDVLCIFEEYVYPGLLGMVLGPVLALGNSVVITANNQLNFCVLLSELATEAGYPPGTITVLNVEKAVTPDFKNWNKWKTVLHFGYDDILELTNSINIGRLLNIQYGKTPMIVFDSADQQSACEVLIDAVWSYNGKLPWSVDTVFVQENIWNGFITKLKRTINQHTLDFAVEQIKSSEIDEMVSDAKARGIEIYQGGEDSNLVAFIGQRVYETNVIKSNRQIAATLTVLPFRTINEGVALANNNRQGLAASIWGENISQVNEAARKLQVSIVWINSFGVFRPNVSFMPWKESGCGYFGGINALLEHHLTPESENVVNIKYDSTKIKSLYAVATTSQMSWAKMGYTYRSRTLTYIVGVLNKQMPAFEEWITAIFKSLSSCNNHNVNDLNDYDLQTYREPIGIIVIEDVDSPQSKQFLFKSLLLGNVVFLPKGINSSMEEILMKWFPKGVFNSIDTIGEGSSIADEHNVMVIVKKYHIPSPYIRKSRHIGDESAELYVTRAKTVWASVGQTYC